VTLAYVGLGANLGDREASIRRAAALIEARRLSTIIETEPWGGIEQPDFLNAVAEVESGLGPRPLLDLLLYGDETSDVAALQLPHPRLHERSFVLVPLAELAPDLVVPGRGRVADLLTKLQSAP
jgi:2-amino-4-hydroxy-6-hydroxymethyldihydropteridine diphosphokinase